jgi:hypothetical protein
MTSTLKLFAAATGTAMLLAGCGSYYQVRDPASSKDYYTTDVDKAGSAVKFKDAKTGSAVTLQNSEVKEISKDDFTKGVAAPAPAPVPAPAAAAVPAPAAAAAPVAAAAPEAVAAPASTQ